MNEGLTEIGRISIVADESGSPTSFEFHPFEMKHDWQKRKIVNEETKCYIRELVEERGFMVAGSALYGQFPVAARFRLGANGDIEGISRLALLDSEEFLEVLK